MLLRPIFDACWKFDCIVIEWKLCVVWCMHYLRKFVLIFDTCWKFDSRHFEEVTTEVDLADIFVTHVVISRRFLNFKEDVF